MKKPKQICFTLEKREPGQPFRSVGIFLATIEDTDEPGIKLSADSVEFGGSEREWIPKVVLFVEK